LWSWCKMVAKNLKYYRLLNHLSQEALAQQVGLNKMAKTESIVTENEYVAIIDSFIKAVDSGKCRLPMNELQKRKEQTDK